MTLFLGLDLKVASQQGHRNLLIRKNLQQHEHHLKPFP